MNKSERNDTYLEVIDDSILMTPEVFKGLIKKFRHHRSVSYGFSAKHTQDIQEYRKKLGLSKNESSIPGNLYNLPVVWNTSVTYVK
jgi:hypothetical protein